MTEVDELQKRRAENLIWNAAKSHGFTPDFKAYDADARADLYWNTVIGAVRRHYEYPKLEAVFRSFLAEEDADVYESLFWLGLENAVYEKERRERPVLETLRGEYAQRFVSSLRAEHDLPFDDTLALAHFRRVLGIDPKLDSYSEKLLNDLEFSADMSTDEIVARARDLFERWFQIRQKERAAEKKNRRIPFGIWLTKQNMQLLRQERYSSISPLSNPIPRSSDGSFSISSSQSSSPLRTTTSSSSSWDRYR